MTIKTKQQLLNQFPDNQTRQITPARLRDLVDTTFDLSDKEYWKVYHVNQGVATDDSGDGTYDNPFYTVHAALERMNEEKALLGIAPGEITESHYTRIIVWGRPDISNYNLHVESLIISAFDYVEWDISPPNIVSSRGDAQIHGKVRWAPAGPDDEFGSLFELFPHTTLPPLMITNMRKSDFVSNFIQYCWDTRENTSLDQKSLLAKNTYSSLYGETPGNFSFNYFEYGDWQGGDLIGETAFNDLTLPTWRKTKFNSSIKDFLFISRKSSSFKRHLLYGLGNFNCFVISGRNNAEEKGTIYGGNNLKIEGTSGIFCKNVFNGDLWNTVGNSVNIFDNWLSYEFSDFKGNEFVDHEIIARPLTDSLNGPPQDGLSTWYDIQRSKFRILKIQNPHNDSVNLQISPDIECTSLFSITGNISIEQTLNTIYFKNATNVSCKVFYLASSLQTAFNQVRTESLCKSNTGQLLINNAVVGSPLSMGVSPTNNGGSGILLVNGILNINSLSCYGDVLMRAGTTANLSGIIEGNLVVAAGATLNAVSLTVKGNVTFEAGATITWMGGTYTGTLTDPDNHFGGATPGSYINI